LFESQFNREINEGTVRFGLLSTLLSDTMKVQEKIEIMEDEYHIPVNDDLRRDVNVMCNLGEGIEEKAIEKTTRKVTEEFVKRMYENHFTLDQIALATGMSIEEAEVIIEREAALV